MNNKYKSAFIVPSHTRKILSEDGWEFETSDRVPLSLMNYLIENLNLKFLEKYLDVESYGNEKYKISIFLDEKNQIQNIHFQIYEKDQGLKFLKKVFETMPLANHIELFIP